MDVFSHPGIAAIGQSFGRSALTDYRLSIRRHGLPNVQVVSLGAGITKSVHLLASFADVCILNSDRSPDLPR